MNGITCFLRIVVVSLFFFPSLVFAQATCDAPEYRHFDFWIGNWEVTQPNGQLAGHNVISVSLNGCILREHYTTPTGYEGYSYNMYDKQTGQWHQTWVDNTGLLLKLDGALKGEAMVLSGQGKAPDGSAIVHRITWTPHQDGTVSQHWETSKDNGENWQQAFLGKYSKIKK